MLKPALVVIAALLMPGTALAQTPPDTTPPDAALQINTTLNSIDSMIGNGLTFSADPSEDLTYTAKATIKVSKKTIVVAKSIREGQLYNQSGGFVEQSIPHGSDSAIKNLIKVKKGKKVAVTLTLTLAGNTKTVTKTVKLKKRY